jgi:tetratricopeptide (TPR) repeat protein
MLCLLVAGSLALTSRTAFAQQTAAPSMSVCQARRTIVMELQHLVTNCERCLKSPPSNIGFNVGELEFQAESQSLRNAFPKGDYRVDLKTLGEVMFGRNHYLFINGNRPILGKYQSNNGSILGFVILRTEDEEKTFADALNALRLYARNYDPSHGMPPVCFADKDEQARIFAEFQKRAAAWRALPAKPSLTDEVNQHWLLAEDELKEKHFDAALREYEAALEIDPLWPLGQFDAAMLSGELKNYDDAVWHMRCYLELTPNAPDAKDAHDQMLLWQARAEQQGSTK